MSNTLLCGQCAHYDPLLGTGEKDTGMGWCAKRSVYPHKEGPGQVFPADVKRVNLGELARPFITKKDSVINPCEHARHTTDDPVAKKQQAQTRTDATGQRILS
jgi:hypothetical protein